MSFWSNALLLFLLREKKRFSQLLGALFVSIDNSESTEKLIEIRASGLPSHMDCPRKWAVQLAQDPRSNFMPIFIKHGFSIQPRRNNIGATIGTACHEAFASFLQAKMDGYQANPEQVGISKFRRLVGDKEDPDFVGDLQWDQKITPDASIAEKQIKRIVAEYLPHAERLRPKRVEFELKLNIDSKYRLTGHPDIYEETGALRDMKFGRNKTPYEAQLGAYSLMAKANGLPISGLFVDHVARNTVNKPQASLEITEYNIFTAENAAYHVAQDAVSQIDKFIDSGDPWKFPANPNSILCSKKWCPAHGTSFCDLGRPGKDEE